MFSGLLCTQISIQERHWAEMTKSLPAVSQGRQIKLANVITVQWPSVDSPRKILRFLEATGDVVATFSLDLVKKYQCYTAKEHKGDGPLLTAWRHHSVVWSSERTTAYRKEEERAAYFETIFFRSINRQPLCKLARISYPVIQKDYVFKENLLHIYYVNSSLLEMINKGRNVLNRKKINACVSCRQ